MTERVRIPLSGTLLVAHLTAYGLLVALDAVGVEGFIGHDPDSQSYEPIIEFEGERVLAREAIRSSAERAEQFVEEDIEAGKKGNARRPAAWARASFMKEPERAVHVLSLREKLVETVESERDMTSAGILAGLGAPAAWGAPEKPKPSEGATALDGVLGNHTSDIVRGVLRPARSAAAALDADPFPSAYEGSVRQLDKTGWAPSGTQVDFVLQWLAVLGLALLPVAHRPVASSTTPACWTTERPRRRGVTLPVLDRPVSMARLRALLGLEALKAIHDELDGSVGTADAAATAAGAGELRALGVSEVVVFDRRYQPGSGSSVAFTFARGRLVRLR